MNQLSFFRAALGTIGLGGFMVIGLCAVKAEALWVFESTTPFEGAAGPDTWVTDARIQMLDDEAKIYFGVSISPPYHRIDDLKVIRVVSVSYDISIDNHTLARSSFIREVEAKGHDEWITATEAHLLSLTDAERLGVISEEEMELDPVRKYSVTVRPDESIPWGDITDRSQISVRMQPVLPLEAPGENK